MRSEEGSLEEMGEVEDRVSCGDRTANRLAARGDARGSLSSQRMRPD